MIEELKPHLPIIVVTTIACIAGTVFALVQVRNAVASLDVDAFSTAVFIIPCVAMLVGSFAITATSDVISRRLYVTVTLICLATGVIAMVVTSGWFYDDALVQALLSNSAEGSTVTVPVQSPLLVMRNIAAYVVVPTVGSIAGAWVGSRLHPMQRAK